jgi:hypothetical protein
MKTITKMIAFYLSGDTPTLIRSILISQNKPNR